MSSPVELRIKIPVWPITQMTGYEPQTTFWSDFSITEPFGEAEIRNLYKRAFSHWKDNVVYLTELVMVLNWKIHQHYGKDDALARVYSDLWGKADAYAMENLKDEDLTYFLQTTD